MPPNRKPSDPGVDDASSYMERLSPRDIETLALCPQDERKATKMVVVAGAMGFAFRTAALTGALAVFDIPMMLAAPLAVSISAGIAAYDFIALQAHDMAEAERTLRRIDATDAPSVSSGVRGFFTGVLRVGTALVTSVVTAGFLAIHLHDTDIRRTIEAEQGRLDAPLYVRAEAVVTGELARFARLMEAVEADIGSVRRSHEERQARWEADIAAAENDVARMGEEVKRVAVERRDVLSEEKQQRDLARCEVAGKVESCERASGVPLEGPRYRLAAARAEAASDEAKALAADLARIEADLADARERLRTIRAAAPELPIVDLAAKRAVLDGYAERMVVIERNRTEALAAIVAADPERQFVDSGSIATKIWALGELARDPWFALAFFAIKGMAFILEMLPIFAGLALAPGEYVLLRGRHMAELTRDLRRLNCSEAITDRETMIEANRARRETLNATRPMTRKERHWLNEIRAAELEAEARGKQRANEWFHRRTSPKTATNT